MLARAALALALTLAPASLAAAPVAPAVDVSIGGGLHTGDVGAQASRLTWEERVGVGVARGPWAVLVSGELFGLSELQEPTSTVQVSYFGYGVEPSVRRELTTGPGLRVHLRLGFGWRRLAGDKEVQRLCDVHGGCDGGFWQETPSYPAHGPVLALGLGYRPRVRGRIWQGFGVELALHHLTLDRKGLDPDLRGTMVSLALNLGVGG